MLEQEGVNAIGFNFVRESPRFVSVDVARNICARLSGNVLTVAVVANMSEHDVKDLLVQTGIRCVQFHGDEDPDFVAKFLPHAYKAIAIRERKDVEVANVYPGEHLLVDAKVDGRLGGTGQVFDWQLVKQLASERKVTLAGGLSSENVAQAIAVVRPYCVDVASGVESSPGIKDRNKVSAFIRASYFTTEPSPDEPGRLPQEILE